MRFGLIRHPEPDEGSLTKGACRREPVERSLHKREEYLKYNYPSEFTDGLLI